MKDNSYKQSINSKIFQRITNNQSLSQSKQEMQATDIKVDEIKMIINLWNVEGTTENLPHILQSHKIRSISHTGNTL